jgi:hypothetical protein
VELESSRNSTYNTIHLRENVKAVKALASRQIIVLLFFRILLMQILRKILKDLKMSSIINNKVKIRMTLK